MPQLNWSYFKADILWKPKKDEEAHLLRTNDLMDMSVKVQRFCLTLVGDARLWYESFRLIVLNWNGLQTQFRQQSSKIGNTKEQLFHVWISFHFDENKETLDACVTCIRHIVALIDYSESSFRIF